MSIRMIVIGIGLLTLAAALHFSSDYMHHKPVRLTVLEEYLPSGGYKSSSHPVFVLQTADGRIFDRSVSFATYHRFSKGDRIVMELRRMDIQQSGWENGLYFFGTILLFASGLASAGVGAVSGLLKYAINRRYRTKTRDFDADV